jgi:hypothetical protein
MDTQHNMEERLWSYIDGHSTAEERSVIERLLETDAAWKAQYQELLTIQQALHGSELEMPSMRFTQNVMDQIGKLHIAPATRSYLNKRLIWGIGTFFILMLVTVLVYGFGMIDWSTGPSTNLQDKLSKISFSNFFSNTWINVFMMINVVLGLFFIDLYLSNKRKQFRRQR